MKNYEKYKTPEERAKAFEEYCNRKDLVCCILTAMAWLDLEVEVEKPLPCPFCGGEMNPPQINPCSRYNLECKNCDYMSGGKGTYSPEDAIAEHNRVALAAMKAKEEK